MEPTQTLLPLTKRGRWWAANDEEEETLGDLTQGFISAAEFVQNRFVNIW